MKSLKNLKEGIMHHILSMPYLILKRSYIFISVYEFMGDIRLSRDLSKVFDTYEKYLQKRFGLRDGPYSVRFEHPRFWSFMVYICFIPEEIVTFILSALGLLQSSILHFLLYMLITVLLILPCIIRLTNIIWYIPLIIILFRSYIRRTLKW